jgi:hypothetical protein
MLTSDEEKTLRRLARAFCSLGGYVGQPAVPRGWREEHGLTAGLRFPAGAEFHRHYAIIRRNALVLRLHHKPKKHEDDAEWELHVATPPDAGVGWRKRMKSGELSVHARPDVLHDVTELDGPWWDDLRGELDSLVYAAEMLQAHRDAVADRKNQKASRGAVERMRRLRAEYEAGRNNGSELQPPSLLSRIRAFLGM